MYQSKFEPTELFQALADRTRLRIMRILVSMPKEEACLCEMTSALQESEPNVSRHFKTLRHAGLLAAEKEGRWVYHRLVPSSQMSLVYRIIRELDVDEEIYFEDLRRFKSELRKRTSSRCTRVVATSQLTRGSR